MSAASKAAAAVAGATAKASSRETRARLVRRMVAPQALRASQEAARASKRVRTGKVTATGRGLPTCRLQPNWATKQMLATPRLQRRGSNRNAEARMPPASQIVATPPPSRVSVRPNTMATMYATVRPALSARLRWFGAGIGFPAICVNPTQA